ncbi:LysR family transcriptional regulator [Methylobacterium sp. 17Sr1-1]|uniref:LysR family transcriptional regulator n=1 Tax=Methylobacterium sp. 17Sr1-1 TaxID=2202826 RepID=UPI000D6FB74F|nr:LysR family transcriptional regulator [Methylobacterium sp. 17Sr1-1]AWN50327.1 LysR family transcriptional regulator [Methylobacterium sp. 17Sr1-1]
MPGIQVEEKQVAQIAGMSASTMNLSQLRILIAVAEAGSVSAAVETTGITQSGMSQALAALEESLGAKLLVRQRHGVALTALGERVLHHAKAVASHLDAIRREARASGGDETGSLRLAAFPSVFATVLPPLLRRFRSRYPEIALVALETDDREVETWLAEGSVDLGVVLNPAADSDAILLGQDAWIALLPAAHPLARHREVTFDRLASEPFVLATGGCHLHAGALMRAAGLSLADIRIEVRDWASAIALVREGAGVSIVPESTLPESRKGLRAVALAPAISRRFGLRAPSTRSPSRAAALFLDLARQA